MLSLNIVMGKKKSLPLENFFKTLSLVLLLFITLLKPSPLLEGENLFRPSLVWASGILW